MLYADVPVSREQQGDLLQLDDDVLWRLPQRFLLPAKGEVLCLSVYLADRNVLRVERCVLLAGQRRRHGDTFLLQERAKMR